MPSQWCNRRGRRLRDALGRAHHRTDCIHVAELLEDENKVISVVWDVERENRFKARIQLIADDRQNLLRDVTQAIASVKANIIQIDLHIEDRLGVGAIVAEVRNLPHLTRLINKINNVKGILRVERLDTLEEEHKKHKIESSVEKIQ